ncbi:MAG: hypothetical protein ACRCZI_08485 [Cetobacterium sp.]
METHVRDYINNILLISPVIKNPKVDQFDSLLLSYDKNKKSSLMIKIRSIILNYLADSDYIFIGRGAYVLSTKTESLESIRYINVMSYDDIDKDRTKLSEYFKKFIDGEILITESDLYVTTDRRIKKHVVYFSTGKNKDIVLNIYNNLTYEVTSTTKFIVGSNFYRVADPIVLLRQYYISIWNIIVLGKIRLIEISQFEKFILFQLNMISYFRMQIDVELKKADFIGKYNDTTISRREFLVSNLSISKPVLYCDEV